MNKQQLEKKERELSTRFSVFLSLLLVVGIFGTAFIANESVKTYTVTLSQKEWESRLQTLQNARVIMRQSTLPGNVVSAWTDSLDLMVSDISRQVGAQLAAEQKKDSTKPKNKP